MALTLLVESQGHTDAGQNVRGALEVIGENAGGPLFTPLRNIDAELRPDALPKRRR